jgi:hypothetical protein
MLVKVMAEEPVLLSCRGSVALAPVSTVPKLSGLCPTMRVGGAAVPTSEMNSSELLALEEISMALMRVAAVEPVCEVLCGVKVTVRVQLAAGRMVEQLEETAKSGVVCRPRMLSVVVPVLLRVTVCGVETLPTVVVAKVSELCEVVKADSGAELEGDASVMGVEVPARSMRLGLEMASLSMMRVLASAVVGGGLEPTAT